MITFAYRKYNNIVGLSMFQYHSPPNISHPEKDRPFGAGKKHICLKIKHIWHDLQIVLWRFNFHYAAQHSHVFTSWWFQPLCKIWKSDWIIIPTIGENKINNVWNHQPDSVFLGKSPIPGLDDHRPSPLQPTSSHRWRWSWCYRNGLNALTNHQYILYVYIYIYIMIIYIYIYTVYNIFKTIPCNINLASHTILIYSDHIMISQTTLLII